MADNGIRVDGLDQTLAAIAAVPGIVRKHADAVDLETGHAAARTARGRISSSPAVRTRRLLNSIVVTKDGGRVRVSVTAEHARHVEFGTRHMPAEPFLTPAAAEQRPAHVERMTRKGPTIESDVAKIGGGR